MSIVIAHQLAKKLAAIRQLVNEQAEDEGLWFLTDDITVAYLQQELRRLHALIEDEEL